MKKEKIIFLIGIFFLILPFSIYGATTLYDAIQVAYDNSKSGTTKTNVQDALDELYSRSKDYCPSGYKCEKMTGAQDLVAKANTADVTVYSDGNTGEMYTFSHGSTIDYRYIGSTPNNYITFNNETWRIIGVFDGKIKIIRNESIENYAWNSAGTNDWTTASLNTTLSTYLSEDVLANVAEVTWYLGGRDYDSTTHYGSASDMYTWERGTTVYSGHPTTWTGKVALMYPSDYAYTYAYGVDDKCYTDSCNCGVGTPSSGWLFNSAYQWLLSPDSGDPRFAFFVNSSGNIDNYGYYVNVSFGVRPVVYLKSDISLTGTGTQSDPYKIVE